MKLTLTVLLAMLCIVVNAQTSKYKLPTNKSGSIFYEQITKVDSATSETVLYGAAKQWLANYFHSSKAVIQSDDKDNNRIIGKGAFLINGNFHLAAYGIGERITFTIQIEIKKGRYRCQIFDFGSEGIDILSNHFERPLDEPYSVYTEDKYKGALLYKKSKLDDNFKSAFMSIDIKTNDMLESLKTSMKNNLVASDF